MPALLLLLVQDSPLADAPLQRGREGVGSGAAHVSGCNAPADCERRRGPYRTRIAYRRAEGWARFTQCRDGSQTWDWGPRGGDTWLSVDETHCIEGDADL